MIFHDANLRNFLTVFILDSLDLFERVDVVDDQLDSVSSQQPQVVQSLANHNEVSIVCVGVHLLELALFEIEQLDVVLLFGYVSASNHQPKRVVIHVRHVQVISS